MTRPIDRPIDVDLYSTGRDLVGEAAFQLDRALREVQTKEPNVMLSISVTLPPQTWHELAAALHAVYAADDLLEQVPTLADFADALITLMTGRARP